MKEFKSWKDIKEWAEKNGYKNMAKRLQLNNDCWESSGEFGRSQVAICDTMRYARTEEARHEWAQRIEKELESDEVLQCV